MDGDSRRMKQHGRQAHYATASSMSSRRSAGRSSGGAADRFRQVGLHSTRGDPYPGAGRPRMSAYMDYGYTDSAFQGSALQEDELQPYPPTLRDQQRQQPFSPYEPEMVYNLGQQGPSQTPYEVVPPYSSRQSAAMDSLPGQFAVSQYFSPNESAGTGGVPPPYLASQLSLSAYNQSGPIGRSSATQPFPATMADMTPVGTAGQQQALSQPQSHARASLEAPGSNEPYRQFQQALRVTIDHTRTGRLVEASRSLLEISEWLVASARELGILRDDQVLHSDRLKLWNDFNICWLALCQKQKDTTQELLQTGRQSSRTRLLSADAMENLGNELIRLCDQMEQHGLVDYQMGIWEEEILSALGQCLDLIESRPELIRSRPVATSRA
ncbi:hypothetical protein ARAM_003576 [Aspergillus rambellii]|uniref:Uncharacterized protein n=1 Tax=Aspergillus rambellii TaxID=308745 RepID=A0A0F8U388_9EURO|nr:hypothetical protein ARAM_003576 [Aspergillus rambellii]